MKQMMSFHADKQVHVIAMHRRKCFCPWGQAAPLDFDFRPFFLHRRREHLYRRIDARCEEMVQRGLLQVMLVISAAFPTS